MLDPFGLIILLEGPPGVYDGVCPESIYKNPLTSTLPTPRFHLPLSQIEASPNISALTQVGSS